MHPAERKRRMALRRRLQCRRLVSVELVEKLSDGIVVRHKCIGAPLRGQGKGCGRTWKREQKMSPALAEKMVRHWNGKNATDVCPHCTKRMRDEQYPLDPIPATGKAPIELFPVRKVCTKGRGAKHSCERAPVLCGRCFQRTCAHLSSATVRIDLATGKRISPMNQAPDGITIGTCGACKREAGWNMHHAIGEICKRVAEARSQ